MTTSTWDRVASVVTAKRSWALGLAVLIIGLGFMTLVGENDSGDDAPNSLPISTQSSQIKDVEAAFPDSGVASAILVATRSDSGELTDADKSAIEAASDRMLAVDRSLTDKNAASPVAVSEDKKSAVVAIPVSAELNGFGLRDTVDELRTAAASGLPPTLTTHVTGGPAFAADIANSFSGANVTLLLVTALVVALLLIATYRSPVLWLVPLIVVGIADRVASSAGTALANVTGLSFDGSTSGITSVLVFGAGTNYALLLISRYREELHNFADHRAALRLAVRRAGPSILASNLTVVLALLILLLATLPNTRSLGVFGAVGLVIAAVFVLLVLPAALALFGRKLFWPFIPRYSGSGEPERDSVTDTGVWHRIATVVVDNPWRAAIASVVVLAICASGLLTASIGLSQTEQFRVTADSVAGFDTLGQHFPAGESDPTVVTAATSTAPAIESRLKAVDGVESVRATGESETGQTRWSLVLDSAPASAESFKTIESIRNSVADVDDADALVGGSDAQALDERDAAARDRLVIIPLILCVVLGVLFLLLRAVAAPIVLICATVASSVGAIGLGSWVSKYVFGFPALDNNVVLFSFLFLVALGVDYTIFLVTRAKEENSAHPINIAMIRAVSATGAVITSAGIVLAAVFCVLGILPLITLTQLGIIVGLGILLDTFLVRTVLVPALFTLVGEQIWWPSTTRKESDHAVQHR
ncbi:MMPL family transporter [Gordonia sp. CPCC 205333]|uniref:MMPL family transporter n=1 Tax=Gordonia sp. CPCC 205333 TaxID=3140790 RepID=UPI003AF39E4E